METLRILVNSSYYDLRVAREGARSAELAATERPKGAQA